MRINLNLNYENLFYIFAAKVLLFFELSKFFFKKNAIRVKIAS